MTNYNLGVRKNMKIFGYDSTDEEFDKILKLSQVTLSCKKEELDSIIDFLTKVKKEIESTKVEDGNHWHYRDYNDAWNEKDSDLIVFIDESANE